MVTIGPQDRPCLDARLFHIDQELGQAVTAIFLGRRRGPEQTDHIVRLMGGGGPDLGAVEAPAFVGPLGLGLGGEQVGAGIRLAHADGEGAFAGDDPRQDLALELLVTVFQNHRSALSVGGEIDLAWRPRHQEFLGDHIALQKAALLATVLLGPGQADPALGRHLAREFMVEPAPRRPVQMLGVVGEKGPHFAAQILGRVGQADRIKLNGLAHHASPTPR